MFLTPETQGQGKEPEVSNRIRPPGNTEAVTAPDTPYVLQHGAEHKHWVSTEQRGAGHALWLVLRSQLGRWISAVGSQTRLLLDCSATIIMLKSINNDEFSRHKGINAALVARKLVNGNHKPLCFILRVTLDLIRVRNP